MTSASSSPATPPGEFFVATTDDVVLTRIVGLGTMNNSVAFQQFVDHLLAQGYPKFVFDLASCDGFDSTFMGIVLGIAPEWNLEWE